MTYTPELALLLSGRHAAPRDSLAGFGYNHAQCRGQMLSKNLPPQTRACLHVREHEV